MLEVFLICLIIFVSAFIQGFAGFAFSLVLIPLLGYFFGFHEIVAMNLLFSFVLNLSVFIKIREHAKLKEVSVLIIFAVIFTVISARYVSGVNDKTLKIVLGLLLVLSSVLTFMNIRVNIKNYKKYYPYVGSVTGILNGMSGISGPVLITFFSNVKMDKLTYKATFNTIFLSLNIVGIASYILFGYIDMPMIIDSSFYAIFVVLGAYAGLFFSHKVEEKHFKTIVTVIIFIMGLSMIVGEI